MTTTQTPAGYTDFLYVAWQNHDLVGALRTVVTMIKGDAALFEKINWELDKRLPDTVKAPTQASTIGWRDILAEYQAEQAPAPLPVTDLKPGSLVHVRAGDQAWQGFYVSSTATSITIEDWVRWTMGDNRPVEGKPNEDLTIPVDDSTSVTMQTDDEDIPVVWPVVDAPASTTQAPAPLPFLLPAANLATGDVVADSEDHYKGGTVAAVTGRGGPGLVEVVWTDHSRGAFTADCLVLVTSRHARLA